MITFIRDLPQWVHVTYLTLAAVTVAWGLIMYGMGASQSDKSVERTMKVNKLPEQAARDLHKQWEVQGARLVLGGAVWPLTLVALAARTFFRIVGTAVTGRSRNRV